MSRLLTIATATLLGLGSAPGAQQAMVAHVFVFTTTECPIANRYAPEIKRLADRFQGRGVSVTWLYPARSDSPEKVREHQAKFGYGLPFARDESLEFVRLTGVTVTPEAAVFDGKGRVAYRGRIDDRYVDFGTERVAPTRRDLESALEAIVSGKPVAVPETRAVGCFLADLVK
ncbi:MAG: redoxin family protein [Vicinamibacterales bacterium]